MCENNLLTSSYLEIGEKFLKIYLSSLFYNLRLTADMLLPYTKLYRILLLAIFTAQKSVAEWPGISNKRLPIYIGNFIAMNRAYWI